MKAFLFVFFVVPVISFAQAKSRGAYVSDMNVYYGDKVYQTGDTLNGSLIKNIIRYKNGIYAINKDGNSYKIGDNERVHFTYPNPFEFELIDTVNASKNELYIKAAEWLANSFKSAKSVIEMQDKEAGKIVGKGTNDYISESLFNTITHHINFTFTIDVRDSKYRIRITNFVDDGYSYQHPQFGNSYGMGNLNRAVKPTGYHKQDWEKAKDEAMQTSLRLLSSFKIAMHSQSDTF